MPLPGTIAELLNHGAGSAPALLGHGRPALDYDGLRSQVARTVGALNALGAGRNDAVAIVLPNGPEMACAFLSIAAGATTAPLNPAYRADEFEFYLHDLDARLLVVQEDVDTPARKVARRLGIPVATLHAPAGAAAGHLARLERPFDGDPDLSRV